MAGEHQIEVRAFSFLHELFASRGWSQPLEVEWSEPAPADRLLEKLGIPAEEVETVFINGRARHADDLINPGDRVALVPPGTPGPYRVLLGFRKV